MVALADWYLLPILPQLGKLFSPFHRVCIRLAVSEVFAEYAELELQPTMYRVEYTIRLMRSYMGILIRSQRIDLH